MEPGIREFFKRIINAMSITFFWMILNATLGIKYNLGFYEKEIQWKNIAFYIWVLASLAWLIHYIAKLWKKPFPMENQDD